MNRVVVGVCVALVVAAAVVTFVMQKKATIHWKALPDGDAYVGPVTPERMQASLARARAALKGAKAAQGIDVERVTRPVGVVVRPDLAWTDTLGRHVGGESIGNTLEVGADLGSLEHELTHLLELRALQGVDGEHVKWEERGFWAADRAYRTGNADGAP